MGFRVWCCFSLLLAYVVSVLIQFGYFTVVYNHLPGKCTRFTMNGSEDMVLYPNNHVLISSGNFFPDFNPKLAGHIFLLDMNQEFPEPTNLTMEGPGVPTDFSPHGMSSWLGNDGSYYLYIINHQNAGDTIESFEYKPAAKKLVHRRSIRSSLLYSLNDLIVVGMDQFYATMDHYFASHFLKTVETWLRVSLACVVYFDGENAMIASENLKYPNGIAKSNDGRYIFVNEVLTGQVVAYKRSDDNSLQRVQVLPLQIAPDNVVVDPKTGDLWVAILLQPMKVSSYIKDRSITVSAKCLHVHLDQTADLPFSNHMIEEVYSSTGEGGTVGSVSVCMYVDKRLLVGSICHDMMLCDAPYLMH